MKTSPSLTSLFPIFGISAAALAVGLGVGRMTSHPDATSQIDPRPVVPEKKEIRLISISPDVSLVSNTTVTSRRVTKDDLKRTLEVADPADRCRGLDALLAKADESEVKQLLEWVGAMPDGASKRVALGKVMQKWGELDGSSAAAYGVDALQQTGNASLLRNALLGWAQSDPSSSIQYLQGLGLGRGLSNDFSRDILGVWSNMNPQAAATYVQGNPTLMGAFTGIGSRGGGGGFGGVASVVAGNWAAQDPQAAANWALSLPSGPQQGSAMNQVLQNWVAQDPNGAVAFVNSQPAGPGKDGMVSSLARGLAADDPASAMKWVSTIGNQGTQNWAAMGVLGQAGVFGPNGPDTALAQTLVATLPQPIQQQIMQRVTNRGGPWGNGGSRGIGR
jgi:hypothetical protein